MHSEIEKRVLDFSNCQNICIQMGKENDVLKQQAKSLLLELEELRQHQQSDSDETLQLLNRKSSEITELNARILRLELESQALRRDGSESDVRATAAQRQAKALAEDIRQRQLALDRFFEEAAGMSDQIKAAYITASPSLI